MTWLCLWCRAENEKRMQIGLAVFSNAVKSLWNCWGVPCLQTPPGHNRWRETSQQLGLNVRPDPLKLIHWRLDKFPFSAVWETFIQLSLQNLELWWLAWCVPVGVWSHLLKTRSSTDFRTRMNKPGFLQVQRGSIYNPLWCKVRQKAEGTCQIQSKSFKIQWSSFRSNWIFPPWWLR